MEITAETGSEPVTYVEAGTGEWMEGELVETIIDYRYDDLYRVIEANYSDNVFYHYAYDANGNRLSETTAAGEVVSTYDIANRLTSVGGVAYSWDDNGNLLSDGVNTYIYDRANRLTSGTTGGETASFDYNGLGDRLVEDGTQFVMDLNTGLTQALSDGTNSYLYGNGRIGQFAGMDSAYFLGDALSSVRQLVDGNGIVTLHRNYAPYGETIASHGAGTTSYAFTSEWGDSLVKLTYLRSRFYSPVTGRFQTKDSWTGDYNHPMSYNLWLYVYSNPANKVDPSGKYSCQGNCFQWEPYDDYNEKQKPSSIDFYGTPLNSPAIFKKDNNGRWYKVPPGTDQSQFIPNWMEPSWQPYKDKDTHTGLCGLTSLTAILTRVYPNISLNEVVRRWDKYSETTAPDYIGLSAINGFIKAAYDGVLKSNQNSFVGTERQFETEIPRSIRQKLSQRLHIITGIMIDGSRGHLIRGGGVKTQTDNGADHWIVITGISKQWDREPEPDSRYKWIRIYNPFDNNTEYYWWPDFRNSWRFNSDDGGTRNPSFLEIAPRKRPFPFDDCCLRNKPCRK